jgi:membrane fusion protein (multidrug efflux system)
MTRSYSVWLSGVFLLLWLTVSGCQGNFSFGSEKEAEDATKEDVAVPVQVVTLERGPIEATLQFSTNLEAERRVEVLAEAARQVRQLLVEEGAAVRKGQLLLRLQDEEQKTTLAKVESELRKVRREYERQKRLHEQGFLSEEDFSTGTYQIEQLELRLEEAERELSYTEVRAPIQGIVTARFVNLGDHVAPGEKLFDVVDFDSIVARVFVPEKGLARLKTGIEARVTAPSLGGKHFAGTIERIAPVVDPQTGTVKVTVAMPPDPALRPGLYVDVALVTDVHEAALLVPKRALVYDQDQIFLYRLQGKTVERLQVRPLLENKESIEPEDGLAEGDQIVLAGQAGLKDGAEVRLVGPQGSAAEDVAAEDAAAAPERSLEATETP